MRNILVRNIAFSGEYPCFPYHLKKETTRNCPKIAVCKKVMRAYLDICITPSFVSTCSVLLRVGTGKSIVILGALT